MSLLDSVGFHYLSQKMKLSNPSPNFVKKFKMRELHDFKIKSDHGGEFENVLLEHFWDVNCYEFSAPRNPHNGVIERKIVPSRNDLHRVKFIFFDNPLLSQSS